MIRGSSHRPEGVAVDRHSRAETPSLAGDSVMFAVVTMVFAIVTVTAFWYFSFFGGDGIDGSYGLISQALAITSRYLLFPLCAAWLGGRYVGEFISRR